MLTPLFNTPPRVHSKVSSSLLKRAGTKQTLKSAAAAPFNVIRADDPEIGADGYVFPYQFAVVKIDDRPGARRSAVLKVGRAGQARET